MFLIFNIKGIQTSFDHINIKLISEYNGDFIEITLKNGIILNTNSYTLESLTEKINTIKILNTGT